MAYGLSVTMKHRLTALVPGLTPRAVLEKLAILQMLDVCLSTTDGYWLIMPRYTQPAPELLLMLRRVGAEIRGRRSSRIKAEKMSSLKSTLLDKV